MEIVKAAQLLSASEVSPCGKFRGGGGWVEWSRALGTQKLQALSQEYSSVKKTTLPLEKNILKNIF